MPTYDWIYYDTQDVGTSANTDIEFFDHTEGADGFQVTNLASANELPDNETFSVEEIHLIFTTDILANDAAELMEEGMIEILISGNRKFIVPAIFCGSNAHYHDLVEDLADSTNDAIATPTGGPYKFRKPLVLPGGVPFKVRFRTGSTAATSGADVIIALRGTLTRR